MVTLAEQARECFVSATKTTSLTAIGRRMRATVTRDRTPQGIKQRYRFSDGSVLISSGRGPNHKMEME